MNIGDDEKTYRFEPIEPDESEPVQDDPIINEPIPDEEPAYSS